MSTNWSIRSLGAPYFCAWQKGLAGMDSLGLGEYGLVELSVTFQVFALPQQYADPQEIHPLISFSRFLIGTRLVELGITPSGQYGAIVLPDSGGPAALSSAAVISPDGQWHTLYMLWDGGTATLTVTLDSQTPVVVTGGVGGYPIAPLSLFMLFNGPNMISRTDVAIRSAWASCSGAGGSSGIIEWLVNEKSGYSIAGEPAAAGTYPLVSSFDLTCEYFPLARSLPWGSIPTAAPGSDAVAWFLQTEYAESSPAETVYTEVALT